MQDLYNIFNLLVCLLSCLLDCAIFKLGHFYSNLTEFDYKIDLIGVVLSRKIFSFFVIRRVRPKSDNENLSSYRAYKANWNRILYRNISFYKIFFVYLDYF